MTASDIVLRNLYLDLIQDVLINEIYKDPPLKRTPLTRLFKALGMRAKHVTGTEFDPSRRTKGLDWPSVAHTMIGQGRMSNLRQICSDVIERGVPGDFIETGVWRGGACIYMRAILKAYGDTGRTVWVADSFEGLPPPNAEAYALDKGDKHYTLPALAISREQVEANFRLYGLMDDQVKFLKGWFSQTLPTAPIDKLAVLRLDGDMYESTMDGLKALYHKVSPGGYVVVDDYHAVAACKAAVHDYLNAEAKGETVEIQEIDGTGVYWQRRV
ncbi:MAG: class I SAM-dependent methyltransferase [Rhodobacter sp.]|nr:class I SAM-dependent methyltransferase [Rhodobacter sp.]